MTVALEETVSGPEAARILGVSLNTVARTCISMYGRIGYGHRRQLNGVDLMVARAWVALETDFSGGSSCARYRRLAETAIRREPRPWLLLTEHSARTHDTAADAAQAWLGSGVPTARIIGLEVA